MKSLRAARLLTSSSSAASLSHLFSSTPLARFISTSPLSDSDDPSTSADFDSRDFSLPISSSSLIPNKKPTWDQSYRDKADRILFARRNAHLKPEEEIEDEDDDDEEEEEEEKIGVSVSQKKPSRNKTYVRRNARVKYEDDEDEDEEVERDRALARALLKAALLPPDELEDQEEEGDMKVKEEDQMSLSVGIIGAPNAGKSSLTNLMVGSKVAAVSRKTNTTTHEVLGVMNRGNTQISFFDTPGLILGKSGLPHRDVKARVENAWSSIELYDLLIVIFDVHRHLTKPDSRVIKLIKHLGQKAQPKQKRLLCMNKIDLVKKKKDLLQVAEEFEDLPGFERFFMVSGMKGTGVEDLLQYLMDQAVKRPWDEDPAIMNEEEIMKNIALEVVREKMLDHIHQEIPYVIDHRLMDWKELRDGSLRVEQHFIALKQSQRQILVGKNGSKIGRIGIEANEELRSIFKREVHLILQVRVARRKNA